jgi:hypothetical protein
LPYCHFNHATSFDQHIFSSSYAGLLILFAGFNVVAAGDVRVHKQALDALQWR